MLVGGALPVGRGGENSQVGGFGRSDGTDYGPFAERTLLGCSSFLPVLCARQVPFQSMGADEDIRAGLEEIDTEEYDGILKKMLKQKMKGIKAANDYERSMKLIRFAVGRGFTLEEVRRFVNQVEPDEYFD